MRSNLTQEQKLSKALEGLEELKQKIIELRFGLCDSKPLTTKEVARILSREASPQTILKFASHHKHDDGSVSFSEKDIAFLEAAALRELARPGQSQHAPEQLTTTLATPVDPSNDLFKDSGRGKISARRALRDGPRECSSQSSRSKGAELKRSTPTKLNKSDVNNQGISVISREPSKTKDSSGDKIQNDHIGIKKSGKRGVSSRKLSKVA